MLDEKLERERESERGARCLSSGTCTSVGIFFFFMTAKFMQSHFSSHFSYPSSLLQSLCSPFFHTSGLSCMHPDVVPICEGWHNCWHNFFRLDPRLDMASRESVCSNCSTLAILMCVHTSLFAFMCSALLLKKEQISFLCLRLFFRQLLELFF